jgi:hypothetical protein
MRILGFLSLMLCLASNSRANDRDDILNLSKIVATQQAQIQALKSFLPPVGSIIAWHKSLRENKALPDGWVECNGQKITVGELAGKSAPNLNNEKRFLRGGLVSGELESDQIQGHSHPISGGEHDHELDDVAWSRPLNVNGGPAYSSYAATNTWPTHTTISKTKIGGSHSHILGAPSSQGSYGEARIGSETRPTNMNVVWIIRIY